MNGIARTPTGSAILKDAMIGRAAADSRPDCRYRHFQTELLVQVSIGEATLTSRRSP